MSLKNNNNNNILSHTDIKSSTNVRRCVSKHDSGDVNISDIISNNHSNLLPVSEGSVTARQLTFLSTTVIAPWWP